MNLNVQPHHLARVMFRAQILHRQAVGRVHTPEFQNYKQVMFRHIITTDKKYVERQYTILITLRFFYAFFVADRCFMTRLQSVGVRNVCSSFSVQLRHKSFVIISISSLVETHVFRLTSIMYGFRQNAIKHTSPHVAPKVSSSYSAHIRNKHKRINTSCFSRLNSNFSATFSIDTLHVVRI